MSRMSRKGERDAIEEDRKGSPRCVRWSMIWCRAKDKWLVEWKVLFIKVNMSSNINTFRGPIQKNDTLGEMDYSQEIHKFCFGNQTCVFCMVERKESIDNQSP